MLCKLYLLLQLGPFPSFLHVESALYHLVSRGAVGLFVGCLVGFPNGVVFGVIGAGVGAGAYVHSE